jgi:hypothetical protein
MGKYIGYIIVILIALFILNWFKIVDIPFLDPPDFTLDKQESIHKTEDTLEKTKRKIP